MVTNMVVKIWLYRYRVRQIDIGGPISNYPNLHPNGIFPEPAVYIDNIALLDSFHFYKTNVVFPSKSINHHHEELFTILPMGCICTSKITMYYLKWIVPLVSTYPYHQDKLRLLHNY